MVDVQGAVEPQQIHNCADHRLTFDDGKNALVLDSRFKIEGLDGEDHPFESWFLALLEHDPHTLDDVVAREPEVRHGISQLSHDLTAQENILLWSLVESVKQVARNPRALTYGDLKAHYLAVARSYPEMRPIFAKVDDFFRNVDGNSSQFPLLYLELLPTRYPSDAPSARKRSQHGGGTVVVDLPKKEVVVYGWPLKWEDLGGPNIPPGLTAVAPVYDGSKTLGDASTHEPLYRVYGALSELCWRQQETRRPGVGFAFTLSIQEGSLSVSELTPLNLPFMADEQVVGSKRVPRLPSGWSVVDGLTDARYRVPVTIDASLQR